MEHYEKCHMIVTLFLRYYGITNGSLCHYWVRWMLNRFVLSILGKKRKLLKGIITTVIGSIDLMAANTHISRVIMKVYLSIISRSQVLLY